MAEINQKKRRGPGRPFQPGTSGNPGGRPKSVTAIEKMLDEEFRTVEEMRENYRVLREVARGVDEPVFFEGAICGYKRRYSSGHMELLLNRLQGPVREPIDLSDAPDSVLEYLAEKMPGLN